MAIVITSRIKKKLLEKHNVTEKEVTECFYNRNRTALKDVREDHQTDPPTLWIIANTNHCRELKLLFVVRNGDIVLKTAYEPNQNEIDIYDNHASYL